MKTAWPLERERSFLFVRLILESVNCGEVELAKMFEASSHK